MTERRAEVSAYGPASWGRLGFAARRRALARGIAVLALALGVLVPSGLAQALRVTTWNLQTPPVARTNGATARTNAFRIQALAAELRQLDPDVILLQQVRDRRMCAQLAQALKPATYHVVACSALQDPDTGAPRRQQVAILAKTRAYFAWWEAWRGQDGPMLPGGFAFAAFSVGDQRVGFISAQAAAATGVAGKGQNPARQRARASAAIEQLLEQVGSVKDWVTNRVQTFVVGGTFNSTLGEEIAAQDTPLRLLRQAGFRDVFGDAPATERLTVPALPGGRGAAADYIFVQPAGRALNPRVQPAEVVRHYPVTCEVELRPVMAVATRANRAKPAPVSTLSQASDQVTQGKPPQSKADGIAVAPPLQPAGHVATAPAPSPARAAPAVASPSRPSTLNWQLLLSVTALAGVVALAAAVWILGRRTQALPPRGPALLSAGGDVPSGYTVVLGATSNTALVAADNGAAPAPTAAMQIEPPGLTQTQAEVLRQRALAAEQRAERAAAVVRAGLLPHLRHWLKQRVARQLVADRAQLLQTQQAATQRTIAVEQRLARIEQQVQRQNESYQQRLDALSRELLEAKEDNRELIRARIVQVKADMEAARDRLMAQSYPGDANRG